MADAAEMIAGYKLRTLLQTGAVSQVYEVVEPSSGRHFAMKILLPEFSENRDVRQNLFHEAKVGIELRHDNIIRIVKVDESRETPHFIMEFFPAGSLRGRLQSKDLGFLREHAAKILKQSATALAYMNSSGWVHCDVKADNILVNSLGELRMIDFAISKKIPTGFARWFHRKKKPQGTPSFMSPEQIRDEILDGRADIYSWGATMYEILTGRPPFRASSQNELLKKHLIDKPDSPIAYNSDLSDDICALILKCLAKKPEDRFANFHDILIKLRDMRIYKVKPIPKKS
ncbi:serine/threonine protein kinase [Tuwongella immobilis]|uniref:Protein kinase domain-containing protein n=1 Tax=Tuwongella immobilis TaxID=692036 RepID=A0A6C2YQE8_9BACT|nr:serine/threonine-protein kinase [Tuwongella immobilis]VIP03112.1 serine threonine protein kinase : Serine/threonine protein kinase OS=Isosphaera pallida (strain ATCC 43644 / DSM 9630 / IS1B) GN=Isop_1188 PE=4 SV=1: Pkinase [Tuwongella immobilis]VTS03424.1 serine threonine protein kinase : Serine/threonine protein kinase OS=Isosphaera pallida (strain ATCC 43644 / DSM 9630 / IS1B) GN=Isop_1188 PE=4 SV=1: Pkinase [Tuwongella immobilis]